MPILLSLIASLGLATGSFLNVVIDRVPRGEPLLSPASRCPGCGRSIRGRHIIPVLGWLLLRGRCAGCAAPISARYPIVEVVTAGMFVAVTLQLSHTRLLGALPAYLFFAAIGIALAVIDVDCHRLPNAIVLPAYPVVAILLTLSSAWTHDWAALARAGLGGIGLFGFYFFLAVVYPAGMGLGDVKLAGVLGGLLAYLSWSTLVIGAFGAFLLGGLAGLGVLISRRGGRKTQLPFGPFMIAGALVALFAAAPIMDWYLGALTGA
jgi:leader peptidase (prepilin peptidase)/N-methyltransferase